MRNKDVPKKRQRGEKRDHAESRARHRLRVRTIAEMMARLEWRPTSSEDLGAEWGLAKSTVEKYAIEASHVVEDALSDGPDFRAWLRHFVLDVAVESKKKGDYKNTLTAARLLADLGGHMAATRSKVEHTGAEGAALGVASVVLMPPLDPSTA